MKKSTFNLYDTYLGLLAGLSIVFAYFALDFVGTMGWQNTKGRIESAKTEHRYGRVTNSHLTVVYKYSVNDRQFAAEDVAVPFDVSEAALKKYARGAIVNVLYDPQNPERSKVSDVSKLTRLFLFCAGGSFVLFVCGLILYPVLHDEFTPDKAYLNEDRTVLIIRS